MKRSKGAGGRRKGRKREKEKKTHLGDGERALDEPEEPREGREEPPEDDVGAAGG